MCRHCYAGAEVIRLSRRNRKMGRQVERMKSMMVWTAYAWLIAAGVLLWAVGGM